MTRMTAKSLVLGSRGLTGPILQGILLATERMGIVKVEGDSLGETARLLLREGQLTNRVNWAIEVGEVICHSPSGTSCELSFFFFFE
jgi:hypothetical protein